MLAQRLPKSAVHAVVHQHAAAVDLADGMNHRQMRLHEDMVDALWQLPGLVVGRPIGDDVGVEDDQVGKPPFANFASLRAAESSCRTRAQPGDRPPTANR